MPTYSYECEKCGNHRDIVKPMRDSDKKHRCTCGSLMIRCYQLGQVVRDTRSADLVMDAYHPLNGPKDGPPDRVGSRTELKTWVRKYNEKYGTGLRIDH
jgi:putative FmdB family regulatory protein